MTVEEGHVLNIDGVAGSTGNGTSGGAGSTANKYKPATGSSADRAMSGVGQRPSVFQTQGKLQCITFTITHSGKNLPLKYLNNILSVFF